MPSLRSLPRKRTRYRFVKALLLARASTFPTNFQSSHVPQGLLLTAIPLVLDTTMASNNNRSRLAATAAVLLGLTIGIDAVPSVNVALKTSFGAPPYLVELLYVQMNDSVNRSCCSMVFTILTKRSLEKRPPRRTQQPTFPCSIALQTATSINTRRIAIYIPASGSCCKMTATSREQRTCRRSISLCPCTLPPRDWRLISNTTTPPSNLRWDNKRMGALLAKAGYMCRGVDRGSVRLI